MDSSQAWYSVNHLPDRNLRKFQGLATPRFIRHAIHPTKGKKNAFMQGNVCSVGIKRRFGSLPK